MKSPAAFYGAIVAAVIMLLLAIYYLIPGVTHVLVSSDPMGAHIKHAVLFGALFVQRSLPRLHAPNGPRSSTPQSSCEAAA